MRYFKKTRQIIFLPFSWTFSTFGDFWLVDEFFFFFLILHLLNSDIFFPGNQMTTGMIISGTVMIIQGLFPFFMYDLPMQRKMDIEEFVRNSSLMQPKIERHSLIRGVLIQSCSAGAKNFPMYVCIFPCTIQWSSQKFQKLLCH